MTDPKRWSEGDDGSELERELLLAGQSARLPESERRALWASIALSLPVAPPPATTPALGATASASAFLTKGAIFLAAVAGLSFGVTRLLPKTSPVAVHATSASVAMAAPVNTAQPSPAPAAVVEPAPAASLAVPSESKARASTTSQLREESVAVLQARAALRSGDAARSLALLEQARLRFPRGALGQEREALTIQALARSGARAAARQRADAFLRAHPQSPYVVDVRLVAGQ
jgi:hypothetical protein